MDFLFGHEFDSRHLHQIANQSVESDFFICSASKKRRFHIPEIRKLPLDITRRFSQTSYLPYPVTLDW